MFKSLYDRDSRYEELEKLTNKLDKILTCMRDGKQEQFDKVCDDYLDSLKSYTLIDDIFTEFAYTANYLFTELASDNGYECAEQVELKIVPELRFIELIVVLDSSTNNIANSVIIDAGGEFCLLTLHKNDDAITNFSVHQESDYM